jgi:hypothetical protein
MAANARKKDPTAVALGRKGGKKGGPARAAKLTPEERSESARKAVQARWAKGKTRSAHTIVKTNGSGSSPDVSVIDTSKTALHLCLKRIKNAKDESEIRRLTQELQRIVFHRQYQNGEN